MPEEMPQKQTQSVQAESVNGMDTKDDRDKDQTEISTTAEDEYDMRFGWRQESAGMRLNDF